jgi:hypothetical protein
MHNVAMTQFSRLGFGVSQVGEGARTSAELASAVVGRDTAFDAESAERGAGRAEQYFAGAALATPPSFSPRSLLAWEATRLRVILFDSASALVASMSDHQRDRPEQRDWPEDA